MVFWGCFMALVTTSFAFFSRLYLCNTRFGTEVSVVEALVLSIMLACTDAALGQAVVTDERIPSRIRQGLNVESGLNDGICVPLLLIVLAHADVQAHAESSQRAVTGLHGPYPPARRVDGQGRPARR